MPEHERLAAVAAVQDTFADIDSTTARTHHDAAGMHLDEDVITALEKAAAEEEKDRSKGATTKNKTGKTQRRTPSGKSDDTSGAGENCD
ncbi:hypothetical protein ABT050_29635 [Streptomyces mirabilis]